MRSAAPCRTRAIFRANSASAEAKGTMEGTIDISHPSAENLVSAFLAMESTDWLLQLARELGGGSITMGVQRFILEHCIKNLIIKSYPPSELYMKKFLKKIIVATESSCLEVLDELYEQLMLYMSSFKGDAYFESKAKVCKCISFIFPDGFPESPLSLRSKKLLVPLWCSLNMLEGDTGCCIWPSSFFLSEFILSYPEVFSNKSCFEVGSGVGLVGICLVHAGASKVTLSDGDLLALANMQLNLEVNHPDVSGEIEGQLEKKVQCLYLPWKSASHSILQSFNAEIIMGADVIYDPSCVPHLIRVLALLLKPQGCCFHLRTPSLGGVLDGSQLSKNLDGEMSGDGGRKDCGQRKSPMAYIATVIRNKETFEHFLSLAEQAHLSVVDITKLKSPLHLLPYMHSYDRSCVRLLTLCHSGE